MGVTLCKTCDTWEGGLRSMFQVSHAQQVRFACLSTFFVSPERGRSTWPVPRHLSLCGLCHVLMQRNMMLSYLA